MVHLDINPYTCPYEKKAKANMLVRLAPPTTLLKYREEVAQARADMRSIEMRTARQSELKGEMWFREQKNTNGNVTRIMG